MDAIKTDEVLVNTLCEKNSVKDKEKFELVGCPINGLNCATILPEINELYAISEAARINKEYQKSADLLQKAFDKTLLLKDPVCASCVEMFQDGITQTLKTMEVEVHDMSIGLFHKKRYEKLHLFLSNFIKKMKAFTMHESKVFVTHESRSVS